MRNTLEEEINKYLVTIPEYTEKEKLSWNEGGELYRIYLKNKEKTLFATSLEKSQFSLRERYKEIFNYCKDEKSRLVKCDKLHIKEDCENQVCYVFVIMEKITPIINLILDEEYTNKYENENIKKIRLLNNVIQAGENIDTVYTEFPYINVYINNEEICLDKYGNAKLQLLDMVKNEIEINNYAFELKRYTEQMAKGLKLNINIKLEKTNVNYFVQECRREKELAEEAEEKDRQILEYNLAAVKEKNVAKSKIPKALTNLGYIFEKGKGTSVDYKKAMEFYERAAAYKYAPAFNNIAHMYQRGYGVEKNYEKAVVCLQKAAKMKDNVAQFNLGMVYHKGKGVDKDMEKAVYWYKKAARNGNVAADMICRRLLKNGKEHEK